MALGKTSNQAASMPGSDEAGTDRCGGRRETRRNISAMEPNNGIKALCDTMEDRKKGARILKLTLQVLETISG